MSTGSGTGTPISATPTITYTGALNTDLDKLRFEIGDTEQSAGILPSGANISDVTLAAILTAEGSVGAAAVRVCDAMARHWRRMANISVGSRREDLGSIADGWQKSADELRAKYGIGAAMFSASMQRDDGYHQMNEFDDGTGGEYADERIIFVRV